MSDAFIAWISIEPHAPVFSLFTYNWRAVRRPLRELPQVLADHGWSAGQDIVIGTSFAGTAGEARDQYWHQVTDELTEIARREGVSVYFPSRGSAAEIRYGGELVVVGGADPRWDRIDLSGRPPRLIQDMAGRLRARSETAFVSLRMSGNVVTPAGELRAGVASPMPAMMRDRAHAYNNQLTDYLPGAFVVDVPLTGDGHIGLVYPDRGDTEPDWRVDQASTADVVALINGGGYNSQAQVIQLLAAPETPLQYRVFSRDAQRIADELDRDVYIVGSIGTTVRYLDDMRAFAAVHVDQDGEALAGAWRLLRPASRSAQAEVPAYFDTNERGVLTGSSNVQVETFANLVTFEPEHVVHDYRYQYQAYWDREEETGGHGSSELATIVVPTRGGRAVLGWQFAVTALANVRAGGLPERLSDRPMRLLFRPVDGIEPDRRLNEWALSFATAMGTAIYVAEGIVYNELARDFGARRWQRITPDSADGRAASMPRYVRNPVTGLLVQENVEANPLPAPLDGSGQAYNAGPPSDLVVRRTGRVIELPGQAGGMIPVDVLPEDVPDGQVVVVAHSRDGRTVLGFLGRDGTEKGEPAPIPPAWMAEIIRRTPGYVPGSPVIFLVPGLGRSAPGVSAPEQYAQQVADLLGARVEAVRSDNPTGDPSEARGATFYPMRPSMGSAADATGRRRLISLPAHLRTQALRRPAVPSGPRAVEVLLQAFSDGSLGLSYDADPHHPQERSYPVSPWFVAQVLAPVLAGRQAVITPVGEPGTEVSQFRLFATMAEVRAQLLDLSGQPEQARRLRARALVQRLRQSLTDGLAGPAREGLVRAGNAVAGVYASLIEGAGLPDGWVAEVQLPGGLWIRPDWPAEHVAAERARLTDLSPTPPARGLIVVGLTGRAVPPSVWTAVRQAIGTTSVPERAILRVRAIDTAGSRHGLADLVGVEETITIEAPLYPGEEPPLYWLAPAGESTPGRRRELYDAQFRALEREINDLLGRIPGTAARHEALNRRIAGITGAFNDLLRSTLTEEAMSLLAEMYAALEEVARELEFAR